MLLDIEDLQTLLPEQKEIDQHGIIIAGSCLKGCPPTPSQPPMRQARAKMIYASSSPRD